MELPAHSPPGLGRMLGAALSAAEPGAAVHRFLRRDGERLFAGERVYDLHQFPRIFLIGFGKAGAPMAHAAAEILGERLASGGIITKDGHGLNVGNIPCWEAGHPLPDERGVTATRALLQTLAGVRRGDLIVCLTSGGGSALFTSPAAGISLSDIQTATAALLACGATIHEINTLRKHIDTVKGGGLARLVHPATVINLILSDVVGDSLEVIASGPTCPDPATWYDAHEIVQHYRLEARLPAAILTRLKAGLRGEILDTPKPGDPVFERVNNIIVGSNRLATMAACEQARTEGYNALLLTNYLQGEARQAGNLLAAFARQLALHNEPLPRPACLVFGGETTVTLSGNGLGGRNQELTLGTVNGLAGLNRAAIITLATDGGDGPTDAAGAIATGGTLARAQKLGMNPNDYLARNDSYRFFDALGDLLRPGPTQTNVNDLVFVLTF